MTCGVYKIINKLNGNCYIGASKNIEKRWIQHQKTITKKPSRRDYSGNLCCNPRYLMEECINLGLSLDDFVFLVLEICDEETVFDREDFWIRRFEPVYNSKTYIDGVFVHKGQRERRGRPMGYYPNAPWWDDFIAGVENAMKKK